MYYVYVLRSKKDDGFYVGYTDNVVRRFKEHSRGLVSSTKDRRPLAIFCFEGFRSKRFALLREKYLKTGWGRNYLAKMFKVYEQESKI